MTDGDAARFWKKVVHGDGCWLWSASKDRDGYGWFSIHGQSIAAHRAVWLLTRGELPVGAFVLHRCDVPACVRPDHLFLGDAKANAEDCVAKGRKPVGDRNGSRTCPDRLVRGEAHPDAKLTDDQVREIRALGAPLIGRGRGKWPGLSWRDLACRFGVSDVMVKKITMRHNWRHVTE